MANKPPLGAGIIGSGWVAGEYIKAFDANPDTYLKGLCTRDPEKGRRKLAECGAQAHVYASLDEMLADEDIAIVAVCTPPELHCEQVIKVARAGKHIAIEKPLAMCCEDVKKMEEAVKEAGVQTVVSFVLRWNPMFETTKKLLADDCIGDIMFIECDYWHWIGPHYAQYAWAKTKKSGGSSLLSAGCHAVDALRWFCGEVAEVNGFSARGLSGSDYEFDPNIVACLRFKNGAIGKISSMLECRTPYVFNVNILGQKGSIRNNKVYSHKFPGAKDYFEYPTILPDSGDVTHHPFQEEINHLTDCLLNGKKCICDIAEAAKTMEACFAIDKAIATGAAVRLPL